jgi:hypothetical protein
MIKSLKQYLWTSPLAIIFAFCAVIILAFCDTFTSFTYHSHKVVYTSLVAAVSAVMATAWIIQDRKREISLRQEVDEKHANSAILRQSNEQLKALLSQAQTAFSNLITVLGPAAPSCDGCRAEFEEALRIARETLDKLNGI